MRVLRCVSCSAIFYSSHKHRSCSFRLVCTCVCLSCQIEKCTRSVQLLCAWCVFDDVFHVRCVGCALSCESPRHLASVTAGAILVTTTTTYIYISYLSSYSSSSFFLPLFIPLFLPSLPTSLIHSWLLVYTHPLNHIKRSFL